MANLFIDKSSSTRRVTEWGHEGNDTILGGSAGDDLAGAQGNDVIHGNGGADFIHDHSWVSIFPVTLYSPLGSDFPLEGFLNRINGNGVLPLVNNPQMFHGGNDRYFGDAGDDVILGLAGRDTLNGGADDDELYGDIGADVLIGATGNDVLAGQIGNDTLLGGDGNDTIHGGSDNDFIEGGRGADVIEGGNGVDTLSYENSIGGIRFNLEHGDFALDTPRFSDSIGDQVFNVENIIGTRTNDIITGSFVSNELYGNLGNDLLIGAAGGDTLNGGAGIDTVSYHSLTSRVGVAVTLDDPNRRTASSANFGDAAGDRLISIENLEGTNFGDTLTGNSGDNRLFGLGGNDLVSGLGGKDRLFGGDGNDTLAGGLDNDTLDGGAGDDLLDGGDGFDVVSYAGNTIGITAQLGAGTFDGHVTFEIGSDKFGALFETDTLRNVDILIATRFDDKLTGSGKGATIFGGEGDDTFFFSEGANVMDGDGGRDMLDLTAASNAAVVDLASKYDIDTIQFATTTIREIENVTGTAFGDTIAGTGEGNVIIGGAGFDRLSGAGGNDSFVFRSVDEIGRDFNNRDVITDFSEGDTINLGLIADTTGVALSFIGTRGFSGEAGQVRAFTNANGNSFVAIDLDGDRQAEARLQVAHFANITLDDLFL